AVEVVRPERAVRTSRLILRPEHEVVDDELTLTVEEVGKRLFAIRPFEHVLLPDCLPGQFTPLPAQFIAQASEFFFLRQQFPARLQPLVARYHRMVFQKKASGSYPLISHSTGMYNISGYGVKLKDMVEDSTVLDRVYRALGDPTRR